MMKIGAACKWLDKNGQSVANANLRTTTIKKLSSLTSAARHEYLLEILTHNMSALAQQLKNVAALPNALKMWRLTSHILPAATHQVGKDFYSDKDITALIDKELLKCGGFARTNNIRISFHPGQFVVLGSQNPGIRSASVIELQHHCDFFTRMGYKGWHPNGLAVNIHVGLKDPNIPAMRALLKSSTEIANFTTLENDEFSWGAEKIISVFGDLVPLVLDVHHYWIHELKRLDPNEKIIQEIRNTWRGVNPKLHLSMSAPELCNALPDQELDIHKLLLSTNRAKLRAHSQTAWHTCSIDYASRFGFDIMWEGKDKNLGAMVIAKHLGIV
jgi:UV DNA damage repair endonuclease